MKNYPPSRQFIPKYTLVIPLENTLIFDSRFESGNLHKAIKLTDNEYNLLIDYDTETLGHTQWYYFSVKPFKSNHTVRFNIINFMKYESLYSEGMKPLIYSKQFHKSEGIDWHRGGFNLGYFQNTYSREFSMPNSSSKLNYFYTLSFSYTFEYEDDLVFFAYSYPYTYTDLNNYLGGLYPKHQNILRINNFCKTIAGNPCYLLTITHNIDSYSGALQDNEKLKKSAAGRRYMKLKELKIEARARLLDAFRGNKEEEGGKRYVETWNMRRRKGFFLLLEYILGNRTRLL
jgi:hypothetical protein